jgi:PleD family two-component response regulator
MTISIGAVAYEDMTMDAEAFVDCADQKLLLAKSSGRDRVVVGDSMAV